MNDYGGNYLVLVAVKPKEGDYGRRHCRRPETDASLMPLAKLSKILSNL
jgi:hypothetical protein